MEDLVSLAEVFVKLSFYLCYCAIAVHFLCKKNNDERLKFLLVVIGVFCIILLSAGFLSTPSSEWDFALTQVAIMFFLALMDVPMMIGKQTAIILSGIFIVCFFSSNFIAFALGMIIYLIITWGLILSAVEVATIRFGTKDETQKIS